MLLASFFLILSPSSGYSFNHNHFGTILALSCAKCDMDVCMFAFDINTRLYIRRCVVNIQRFQRRSKLIYTGNRGDQTLKILLGVGGIDVVVWWILMDHITWVFSSEILFI